jgi:O-methyltransferase involved in polyketide biosynthesis
MTAIADAPRLSAILDQLAVLGIAEGFFQSSVLFALLKLNVFEHIGIREVHVQDLASHMNVPPDRLARVLNMGVVLKLLESADGLHYRLGGPSRTVLLKSAGEDYLGDWVRNLANFQETLSALDEAVAGRQPTRPESGAADPEQTREFTLAMHNFASLRGRELAHYLNTAGCRTLLDLGSGPGTYAFRLGLANPELHLYLLDAPAVLEVAREVQSRYSLPNEVDYMPGDAVADQIPGQYDLVLISNVLHMLGPDASRHLIRRLHDAVNPGGSLVVQAQFLREDRLGDRWPVLLDLLMLSLTPAGQNHSVKETTAWMQEAGFRDVQLTTMGAWNTNSFLRGYRR